MKQLFIKIYHFLDFCFNMNPKCATEVNTPSGRFTFHKDRMSVCEAKKFCAQRGEILAPITNQADFDALHKAVVEGNNPSCPFHYMDIMLYSIGLDITPCGKGKQDRIFTNGVAWDNDVHGKLYYDYGGNKNCLFAVMDNQYISKPAIYSYGSECYQTTQRVICLKEAVPSNYSSTGCSGSSVSQAITSQVSYKGNFVGGLLVACLSLVGVFFAFVAIKYHKKYQAVQGKTY